MPRFERRERKGRRDSGRGGFEEHRSRGGSGRGSRDSGRRYHSGGSSDGRGRGDVQMTKVICSKCGDECEVPFKPQTNKPLFCSDCFSKQEGGSKRGSGRSSSGPSNRDIEQINKKLDKIMKALEID